MRDKLQGNIQYFNILYWAYSPKSRFVHKTQGFTLGWNIKALQAALSILTSFEMTVNVFVIICHSERSEESNIFYRTILKKNNAITG